MKKYLSAPIAICIIFSLATCTKNQTAISSANRRMHNNSETMPSISIDEQSSTAEASKAQQTTSGEDSKTLIGVFNFKTGTVRLNSGYEMPLNGLGTYSLHEDVCRNSVRSALENGVRLIDTASIYGNEEEIGQAIRKAIDDGIIQREDIFVTTKIYPGSEMANPEEAIQNCLDRLNIGYVDMMLLHHPDQNDVKAYKAMEQFVKSGTIHSIGLSNWYVEELTEFLPQIDIVPAIVQNEINPLLSGK